MDKPPYVPASQWPPPGGGTKKKRKPRTGWLALCLTDEKNRIVANLANAMIALRSDSTVERAFAFDEMAQAASLIAPLPVAPNGKPAGNGPLPRPVHDEDISQLQEWLQHQGLPRIGKDTVHQAVDLRAREFPFHPVREWLDGLAWDGTERLSGWLKVYLGASGPENYLTAIGRMFLIAMVARVFEPGCKADYLLVLEGDQGIEKSRACQVLAGEWFSDSLPNIHDKDAKMHLRGKWLLEVPELAGFARAETEALKAFITRTHERYRPVWGRRDVIEPRQCLFIGSTNCDAYIKDETGGRRFWPVKVGRIDIAKLIQDRDQLFAEALERFRHGEEWWPGTQFETVNIKPQQEARRDADAWEAKIADWLAATTDKKVLIWEVAAKALSIEVGRLGRADQLRIAVALCAAGWSRASRTGKGQWWENAESLTEKDQ